MTEKRFSLSIYIYFFFSGYDAIFPQPLQNSILPLISQANLLWSTALNFLFVLKGKTNQKGEQGGRKWLGLNGWNLYTPFSTANTERVKAALLRVIVAVHLLSCVQPFVTLGLQHARLPSPSLSPGVCSNSRPLSRWCLPIISSSVTPFSSCPQSSSASGFFPVSWLYTSDGPSIGASTLASHFQLIFRTDFL